MYIVIEKFGGWEYAAIVTDEDGNNKIFNTVEEAQTEADDCQDGIIIGDEIVSLDAEEVIKSTFFEETNEELKSTKFTYNEVLKIIESIINGASKIN